MKIFLFTMAVLLFGSAAMAQNQNDPFEGKVFTIENFINGKFDNREDLTFESGTLEGSVCIQYGFEKAKYRVNKDGMATSFYSLMKSNEEGTLEWNGKYDGKVISGKCLWKKEGQDDILLTFRGELKN